MLTAELRTNKNEEKETQAGRVSNLLCIFILQWETGPQPTHVKPAYLLLPLAVPSISFPHSLSLSIYLFSICVRSPYFSFALRVPIQGFYRYATRSFSQYLSHHVCFLPLLILGTCLVLLTSCALMILSYHFRP